MFPDDDGQQQPQVQREIQLFLPVINYDLTAFVW